MPLVLATFYNSCYVIAVTCKVGSLPADDLESRLRETTSS